METGLEQNKHKTIISVKEARKLLGKSSKGLSDDHIRIIIKELQSFALIFIESFRNADSNAK